MATVGPKLYIRRIFKVVLIFITPPLTPEKALKWNIASDGTMESIAGFSTLESQD